MQIVRRQAAYRAGDHLSGAKRGEIFYGGSDRDKSVGGCETRRGQWAGLRRAIRLSRRPRHRDWARRDATPLYWVRHPAKRTGAQPKRRRTESFDVQADLPKAKRRHLLQIWKEQGLHLYLPCLSNHPTHSCHFDSKFDIDNVDELRHPPHDIRIRHGL